MIKRLFFVLAVLAFGAVAAQAGTVKGTIHTVKGDTVTVFVKANLDKAKWVKDGTKIQMNRKLKGIIISVKESVITIVTKKADKLKVDDKVSIKKYRVMSGC